MSYSPALLYFVLLFGLLSLAALVFFSARTGIQRLWPAASHPTVAAALLSAAATPLLCVGGFYLFLAIYLYYPHRDFDARAWAANQPKRYEMVADLQDSQQLVGMTAAEVTQLLGTPDMRYAGSWEYDLGMKPKLFHIDGDALSLDFRNGRVVRCWVHET